MRRAAVIGTGPAGLMAADVLAEAGLAVTLYDAKPSVGRKFLMAGKSGLNLTKDEGFEPFMQAFSEAQGALNSIIRGFDATAVKSWAEGLGQEVFTGSTGRVFPVAMKASPLLRAWMNRLDQAGVTIRTRWERRGWQGRHLRFDTPGGPTQVAADVTVLALGGASWMRLGSTGEWADILAAESIALAPFAPANAGLSISWTEHMTPHFGTALKNVSWHSGPYRSQGEAVLSARGLEGGGIYSISRGVREGHRLFLDLLPNLSQRQVQSRLEAPRGKASLSNHLRKRVRLTTTQIALFREMAQTASADAAVLAPLLKALPVTHHGLRPMDEAISTAGGIPFSEVDQGLMLAKRPGVFVAGEMLDWEAPTGGYLISGCLATGRWAGQHAAQWVPKAP